MPCSRITVVVNQLWGDLLTNDFETFAEREYVISNHLKSLAEAVRLSGKSFYALSQCENKNFCLTGVSKQRVLELAAVHGLELVILPVMPKAPDVSLVGRAKRKDLVRYRNELARIILNALKCFSYNYFVALCEKIHNMAVALKNKKHVIRLCIKKDGVGEFLDDDVRKIARSHKIHLYAV